MAAQAGLTMKFTYGDERKKYIVEANGSGVAFLDYDNDGLQDIFLVNGSRLEGFPKGQEPTNHLYRNTGHGTFLDVTPPPAWRIPDGATGSASPISTMTGSTIYMSRIGGSNVLSRNSGKGGFADVTAHAGVGGGGKEWSTGCTFIDYDRDGLLDLLVTSYHQFDPASTPPPVRDLCQWHGLPVFCGPRGRPFGKVTLYHNRGDGTFEDVSESGNPEGTGFLRFHGGGSGPERRWLAGYVCGLRFDSEPLLRNNKDGTFSDIATEAGWRSTRTGANKVAWGWLWGISITTGGSICSRPISPAIIRTCIATWAGAFSRTWCSGRDWR